MFSVVAEPADSKTSNKLADHLQMNANDRIGPSQAVTLWKRGF